MKRKLKILLITPLAAGAIIAADATRSDAFILDTLDGLWKSTTNIVKGTLNSYVGQYVTDLADHYIPRGLESIAGALGLPDPGGMFDDIRAEAEQNKTNENDIVLGDLEDATITRSFGEATAEATFSQEGQEATKQSSELVSALATSSAEIAKACQQQNITQEVGKCTNQLLANAAQSQQVLLNELQQQRFLLANGTMVTAKMAKHFEEEARGEQAQVSADSRSDSGQCPSL